MASFCSVMAQLLIPSYHLALGQVRHGMYRLNKMMAIPSECLYLVARSYGTSCNLSAHIPVEGLLLGTIADYFIKLAAQIPRIVHVYAITCKVICKFCCWFRRTIYSVHPGAAHAVPVCFTGACMCIEIDFSSRHSFFQHQQES